MVKVKSKWICQQCGYETAGYLGKCPECGSWGSFTEEILTNNRPQNISPQGIVNNLKPSLINDIHIGEEVRISTNISEFDRILGGGLVQGSLVLIAGDPGIGKSTILLQTSGELAKNGQKILYVSAEESASQLKLRANRLGIKSDSLYIYPQTNLESIRQQIDELKPDTVVIDQYPSYLCPIYIQLGRERISNSRMLQYTDADSKNPKYYSYCNRPCYKRRKYRRS